MSDMSFVKSALEPFCRYSLFEGQAAVTTHCLYPSNSAVTVYVSGGPSGAVVSDEGGAASVLAEHGRVVPDIDRYLKRFCHRGLKTSGGKIFTPPVSAEQLTAAVMLVANASSEAAKWGVENLRVSRQRNLRKELYDALSRHFPKEQIDRQHRITGKSNRQYRFDNVVKLSDGRILVVDAVVPDPNSINAHAVAHLDLSRRGEERILQRMVYDEEADWQSSDLNLLQMAAKLVPLSGFDASLDRLTKR